jgi:hypothetical protein
VTKPYHNGLNEKARHRGFGRWGHISFVPYHLATTAIAHSVFLLIKRFENLRLMDEARCLRLAIHGNYPVSVFCVSL